MSPGDAEEDTRPWPTRSPRRRWETLLDGADHSSALIDVREVGEYNSSHIPGARRLPRRQLEASLPAAVPFLGVPLIVLCDDDGRRARLAAAARRGNGLPARVRARRRHQPLGHRGPAAPSGASTCRAGLRREGRGRSPPCPEVEAKDLADAHAQGEKFRDPRHAARPRSSGRFCIPGGRSVPRRRAGAAHHRSSCATSTGTRPVIVNCAGRTRSIIGARVLQRMGIPNVCGPEERDRGLDARRSPARDRRRPRRPARRRRRRRSAARGLRRAPGRRRTACGISTWPGSRRMMEPPRARGRST